MAPRKFYCHYCDVRLPYSRDGRLRHSNGNNHLKNRRLYYQQFQTCSERLEYEASRDKCKKFLSSGTCSFGESCIFSHLTQQGLASLQEMAKQEEIIQEFGPLPCQQLISLSESTSGLDDAGIEASLLRKVCERRKTAIMNLFGNTKY